MPRRKEPYVGLDFSKGVRGKYAMRYSKRNNTVPFAPDGSSPMGTKVPTPEGCLSCGLLRYIRDAAPSEDEFLAWLGGPDQAGIYHTLRKARLLLLDKGRLQLAPAYLSSDGKRFSYASKIYHLETDEVWLIRGEENSLRRDDP